MCILPHVSGLCCANIANCTLFFMLKMPSPCDVANSLTQQLLGLKSCNVAGFFVLFFNLFFYM